MQISAPGRERCLARRYYVHEALGLIWLSIESEQSLPFPGELTALSETSFTVRIDAIKGPVQPWLDHYLDVAHIVSNHLPSATGKPLDAPVIAEASMSLPEDPEQRPEASIIVTGRGVLRPGIIGGNALWLLYLGGLPTLLRGLRAGGDISSQMIGRGLLLNPALQYATIEYRSPLGSAIFVIVTALNPRSANDIQVVNIIASRQRGGWLKRRIEAWEMPHVIGVAHVFGEDNPVVSGTKRSDLADYQLVSPLDEPVPAMRARLARYIAAKGHLYPRDSVLHQLKDVLPESHN